MWPRGGGVPALRNGRGVSPALQKSDPILDHFFKKNIPQFRPFASGLGLCIVAVPGVYNGIRSKSDIRDRHCKKIDKTSEQKCKMKAKYLDERN